jgi:hypothetical protein
MGVGQHKSKFGAILWKSAYLTTAICALDQELHSSMAREWQWSGKEHMFLINKEPVRG